MHADWSRTAANYENLQRRAVDAMNVGSGQVIGNFSDGELGRCGRGAVLALPITDRHGDIVEPGRRRRGLSREAPAVSPQAMGKSAGKDDHDAGKNGKKTTHEKLQQEG